MELSTVESVATESDGTPPLVRFLIQVRERENDTVRVCMSGRECGDRK